MLVLKNKEMLAHWEDRLANLNYYAFKLLLLLALLSVYCYFKYVVDPHDENSRLQR